MIITKKKNQHKIIISILLLQIYHRHWDFFPFLLKRRHLISDKKFRHATGDIVEGIWCQWWYILNNTVYPSLALAYTLCCKPSAYSVYPVRFLGLHHRKQRTIKPLSFLLSWVPYLDSGEPSLRHIKSQIKPILLFI